MCGKQRNRGKKMHHSLVCRWQQGIACEPEVNLKDNLLFRIKFWGSSNKEKK